MMMAMSSEEEVALGQRIAKNLQALMRSQGLNQGQLAYKAGLSTSNISNLVNGRKNPSFYSVAKAAMALDADPLEVAGFRPLQIPEPLSSDHQVSPSDFASLARQVRDLSQTVRRLEEGRHKQTLSEQGPRSPRRKGRKAS